MKQLVLSLLVLTTSGCGANAPPRQPEAARIAQSAAVKQYGTLKLGSEAFAVVDCVIWGYLDRIGDKWYCRWCIDADAEAREFTKNEDGELYNYEVQPSLSANTIPIAVTAWRDLDGQSFKTGEHGEANFFDNGDHSAMYTMRTMSSYELCSNNSIALKHESGKQFHVRWTGQSYLHGVDADRFELDALATLTSVSVSSEVEAESDVSDVEIGRIFASVFPNGDFDQQPAKIDRTEEDGQVTIRFKVEFTPK